LALLVTVAMVAVLIPAQVAGAAPDAPLITGSPESFVGADRAAFSFTASGALAYECRVFSTGTPEAERPGYQTCSGGSQGYHLAEGLTDGNWTFEVRGLAAGEPGPSSTHDWNVSSGAVVQWVSEPEGAYNGRYVTATFTAAGATSYRCRVYRTDVATPLPSFTLCGSGQQGYWVSNQLADGAYRLEVQAAAPSPGPVATAEFSVGDVLPVTWVARPEGAYTSRFVSATFTAPGATNFDCRVYRTDVATPPPNFTLCGSGQQGYWVSNQLADGAYRLEVKPRDSTGPSLTPASTEFSIGDVQPITWVSRPEGTYGTRYLSATFVAPNPTNHFCRTYRTDVQPETLVSTVTCGSGTQGFWTSSPLVNGDYRLEVQAQDATGLSANVASTTFSVRGVLDLTWEARPSGVYSSRYVTATFTALRGNPTSYQCRLYRTDPPPSPLPGFGGCNADAGTWISPQLADGSYRLDVRAVDAIVSDGPPLSTTFAVDTTVPAGPDLVVTSGPAEGSTVA
jgi:hypothetical protein